jgi:uncharacterized membrane protein YphA (DoxX/SURF4 family)
MQRARAVNAFVVWAISVFLAAVFLLAGIPKVIGTSPVGFQAAAMQGFPTWIRVVIGIFETACAVALLLPSVATLAAVCLALLMVPATFTQYMSAQPGVWVPLLMLLLLAFVAWRRSAQVVSDGYHEFAAVPHPLLREGIIAGLIGAMMIIVWFGIIDMLNGRPFFTPATLGRALLSVFGTIPQEDGPITFVLVYTIFHFAAFLLVGLLASLIVVLARREPSILIGFLILFAATEVGIYGFIALFEGATALGHGAWLQIMVGNLLASAAMGYYFWWKHHELEHQLRHAFDVPPDEEETSIGGAPGMPPRPVAHPPLP